MYQIKIYHNLLSNWSYFVLSWSCECRLKRLRVAVFFKISQEFQIFELVFLFSFCCGDWRKTSVFFVSWRLVARKSTQRRTHVRMLLVMALKKLQEGHHGLPSVFLEQSIELHCMYTLDNLIVISCTETLFLKQAFSVIKIEWRCLRQQQKPLEGEQVNNNLKFWLCWNFHMSKETWNLPTRVTQSFHDYSMFIFFHKLWEKRS